MAVQVRAKNAKEGLKNDPYFQSQKTPAELAGP
jgi:hypothetical protein